MAVNSHPSPTTISSGAEVGKIPRILQHLLLDTDWPEAVVRLLWQFWRHSPKHQGLVQAAERMSGAFLLHTQPEIDRRWKAFLREHLTGQVLVLGLEHLVETGQVARSEVAPWEDKVLASLNYKGHWKLDSRKD